MGQSFFASLVSRGRKGEQVVDLDNIGDGPVYEWPDPAKPSAVLVPPIVRAHRVRVRVRKIVSGILAGTAVVSVLAGGGAMWLASSASDDRAAAENDLSVAQAEVTKYAPYAYYAFQLQERQQALNLELGADIDYSVIARNILDAQPSAVFITGFDVTPGAPCPTPEPFTSSATLGCVKISGEAPDSGTVGAFVTALNAKSDEGLSDAFANSLSDTTSKLEFTITVNYSDAVLSYRYVPEPADTVEPTTDPAAGETTGETTDGTTGGTTTEGAPE